MKIKTMIINLLILFEFQYFDKLNQSKTKQI